MMKTHTLGLIAGAALVVLVVLGGVGAVAMAADWIGTGWGTHAMMGRYTPYATPGQYGSGGMMSPGNMMGGYGQTTVPSGTPASGVTTVAIQNFAFQPASIQVKAGTTVTWTNEDTVPHTVTFHNGMRNSGMLQQGQSFSYTFTSPGTYAYYCAVHPSMVGIVTVTS